MVGMARPACGGRADGGAQVIAYKAPDFRQSPGCRIRVQRLRSGGQLSSGALSYLGAGFSTGFGDMAANNWVPGQLPALLDSAAFKSGQLSAGTGG